MSWMRGTPYRPQLKLGGQGAVGYDAPGRFGDCWAKEAFPEYVDQGSTAETFRNLAVQPHPALAELTITAGDPNTRLIEWMGDILTTGAPHMCARCKSSWTSTTNGVAYYEVTVLADCQGLAGFALSEFESCEDDGEDYLIGDDSLSWGFDLPSPSCSIPGGTLHHDGSELREWTWSTWKIGDVIGLAASAMAGKIAISVNGDWSADRGFGVVVEDERIKAGIFPVLSGEGGLRLRCAFGEFSYGPPPADMWAAAAT